MHLPGGSAESRKDGMTNVQAKILIDHLLNTRAKHSCLMQVAQFELVQCAAFRADHQYHQHSLPF
jgi:hypothetical protein